MRNKQLHTPKQIHEAFRERIDTRTTLSPRYEQASCFGQPVLSSPGAASYCCASSPGQAPSTRCILVPLPLTTLLRTPRECRSRSLRPRSPSPTTPRCPRVNTVQTRHAVTGSLETGREQHGTRSQRDTKSVASTADCCRLFPDDVWNVSQSCHPRHIRVALLRHAGVCRRPVALL